MIEGSNNSPSKHPMVRAPLRPVHYIFEGVGPA